MNKIKNSIIKNKNWIMRIIIFVSLILLIFIPYLVMDLTNSNNVEKKWTEPTASASVSYENVDNELETYSTKVSMNINNNIDKQTIEQYYVTFSTNDDPNSLVDDKTFVYTYDMGEEGLDVGNESIDILHNGTLSEETLSKSKGELVNKSFEINDLKFGETYFIDYSFIYSHQEDGVTKYGVFGNTSTSISYVPPGKVSAPTFTFHRIKAGYQFQNNLVFEGKINNYDKRYIKNISANADVSLDTEDNKFLTYSQAVYDDGTFLEIVSPTYKDGVIDQGLTLDDQYKIIGDHTFLIDVNITWEYVDPSDPNLLNPEITSISDSETQEATKYLSAIRFDRNNMPIWQFRAGVNESGKSFAEAYTYSDWIFKYGQYSLNEYKIGIRLVIYNERKQVVIIDHLENVPLNIRVDEKGNTYYSFEIDPLFSFDPNEQYYIDGRVDMTTVTSEDDISTLTDLTTTNEYFFEDMDESQFELDSNINRLDYSHSYNKSKIINEILFYILIIILFMTIIVLIFKLKIKKNNKG